jgi:hypothetical protein
MTTSVRNFMKYSDSINGIKIEDPIHSNSKLLMLAMLDSEKLSRKLVILTSRANYSYAHRAIAMLWK